MLTSMWSGAWCVVVLVAAANCAAAAEHDHGGEDGDGDVMHRFKRQIGFTFGAPNFNFARPTNSPGRQEPGRPVDVGHVLGSVIGGFLNPQSQNSNNNLAGALAGLNNALNPNQLSGSCNQDQGGCEQGCRQQGRFVRCFCNSGFVLNRDRKTCSDINECQFSNAGCRHGCNNTPGSFECTCRPGFSLAGDGRSCQVGGGGGASPGGGGVFPGSGGVAPGGGGVFPGGGGVFPGGGGVFPGAQTGGNAQGCAVNNGGCEHTCEEKENGKTACRCEAGYRRDDGDKTKCVDVDECERNNGGCSDVCTNTVGSFKCSCPGGKVLNQKGKKCIDPPTSCADDNGGCEQTCFVRENGKTACRCEAGYRRDDGDKTKCVDVNECERNNGGCSDVCTNTVGSFECSCTGDRVLNPNGKKCKDPVAKPAANGAGSCDENNGGCEQICRERNGRVRCRCEAGYTRNQDLRTCTDIDECTFNNGGCTERCTNTPGSFECGCERPGDVLQSDGRSCSPAAQPVTESCSVNNGGCSQVCQQTFQGVRCFCNQGYNLLPDGRNCADLNECDFRNGGCSDTCTNTAGSYTCSCSGGGTLLQDGRTCASGGGCAANNGGCEQTCNPNAPSFFGRSPCGCNPGYTLNNDGRTCSDINECQFNNGNCAHICNNEPGSFSCQCRPGFRLSGNTCQAIPSGEQPPTAPTSPTPGPSQPSTQLRSCGQNANKNINNQIRIVGGTPANPDDWPWMAALLQSSNNNQYCGGALVTDRHVLTAAHCVVQFKSSDIKVRVGEYDFQKASDNSPLDFNVADIEAHEQYDTKTQEHDIAILKLDRAVEFSNFVQPVCLPPPGTDVEGLSAFVIGWGTTAFGGPVSNVLREVQVPIWTRNDCDASYPDKVFDHMMCAGLKKGGKDSCQGDSGGPLLTQLPGSRTWYVVGVVSWGIECARADRPGVYTTVVDYLSWIDSKLQ